METGPGPQVCAFLFQLITAVQFFFALAINSMSLMMDCISMEIDVVTYLGNLYAEVKRQSHELSDLDKAKISLVFSGISIGILTGMTTYGLIDVISTLAGGRIKDDLHPAWYLIIFGGFGFLFDCICLCGRCGRPGSVERRGTGIATPSSRRRVDGVEDDAMIQHKRAVEF